MSLLLPFWQRLLITVVAMLAVNWSVGTRQNSCFI